MRNFFILPLLLTVTLMSCKKEMKIDLSSKKLTVIPDSIFKYKNSTELHLGAKDIVFYPPLSAVSEGDRDRNRISKLPDRIAELKFLKILVLNSNKLKTLPNAITGLKNLEVLDLGLNYYLNIKAELPKLMKLPQLKILKITATDFNGADLKIIEKSLGPQVRIIHSVDDYMKSYGYKINKPGKYDKDGKLIVFSEEVYMWLWFKSKNLNVTVIDTFCINQKARATDDIRKGKLIYFSSVSHLYPKLSGMLSKYGIETKKHFGRCVRIGGFEPYCYQETMWEEIDRRYGKNFIDSLSEIAKIDFVKENPHIPYMEDGIDLREKYKIKKE